MDIFRWKENWFLLGNVALKDPKHPNRDKIAEARTINLKNIISLCKQRIDEWAGQELLNNVYPAILTLLLEKLSTTLNAIKNYISMFCFLFYFTFRYLTMISYMNRSLIRSSIQLSFYKKPSIGLSLRFHVYKI